MLASLASGLLWTERRVIALLQGLLFQPWNPRQNLKHIVIYRVGNLGDTVLALPALAAIRQRYPDAKLTLLTSPGSAQLVTAETVLDCFESLIDRSVSYIPAEIKSSAGLQNLKQELLKTGPIDAFIGLPLSMQTFSRSIQELFFAKFIGAPIASGFGIIFPPVFKQAFCRTFPDRIPETHQWLLTQLTWEASPVTPSLKPQPEFDHVKKPFIAINPGAKLALKQWPRSFFIQTIKKIAAERPNLNFVLLGNPASEADLIQSIVDACPELPIHNLCGHLTIADTFQLLPEASAVLTNDTGLLHMAGIANVPIIAPVSGQFPAHLWNPPNAHPKTQILRHDVPCAPCFRDECPYSDEPCLTSIRADRVLSAILSLL